MSSLTAEGTIPLILTSLPAKQLFTWYKIVGDLHSGITPLVAVHGGPGLSHDYTLALSDLNWRFGIPVLFYDQVGGGRSSHLREKRGEEGFWVEDVFIGELFNLVEHLGLSKTGYYLLGQSWGGMLSSTFASKSPPGLRKLILAHAPGDISIWDANYRKYLSEMPQDVQTAVKKHLDAGTTKDPEFESAVMNFYQKHMCTVTPFPEELRESMRFAEEDDTVDFTMNGTNPFETKGSLKGWNAWEHAKKITVPTLVINGTNEGAADEAIRPFTEGIEGMKWVKFEHSTHMSHNEEKEKFMDVVGSFLMET